MGANIVLSIWSLTPASRLANLANFLTGELFSYDASTLLKDIYKNFIGENVDLENTHITVNGFLETIVDGVVYARPFMPNAQGSVFGNGKSDILFGGSGKDIFIGHGGNDLFIGGDGKDDYFVNNSFITIKDSDGKGRVFDNNYKQLRGGTYSHSKNGEDKYFDGDTVYSLNKSTKTLHISSSGNGSITIENFNKDRNDLDIVLLDPKDITVSILDSESSEGDSLNQSMKFKVKLNRKLEKEETLTLKINDEEIVFKENDQEKDFTYKWNGDTIKQEDRVFNVSATVVESKTSKNLKVRDIKQGTGKIIDDDRNPDPDDPETDASPIVLDLNKNGITSTKLDNTVYFDHDNNGFKEATAWIEKDDGLLALDKNGNGKIDNGSELFGNHTVSNTAYGYTDPKATNGYEALKTYDINNDNVIDEKDEIFSKLKIWKDKNLNGITDEGELSSLAHNNIKSIDLNYNEIALDENSNMVKQSSKVTLNDDSTINANDVWFKVNLDKTKEEDINIPLEIKSLPQVKAFGNLNSLQVAASKNEKLATMINLYLMLNPEDRKKHINDIVYEWAGVNDMDEALMRGNVRAKDMSVYEKITGKPFLQYGNSANPGPNASNRINEKIVNFKNFVYATIELQTTYADIDLDTETMSLENNGKPSYKFDALNSKLTQLYKDNRHDEIKNLMDIVREAGAYKPVFQETLKTNLISLCSSDNKFLSLCLNTYIQGTDDDNTINGSFENNFIVGGKGNDILYGGGGNDIYAFAKGDGKDTIYDTAGNDKIEFKEGIAPGDVSFKRELDKLIISIKSGSEADGDNITVQNFFSVNPAIGNNTVRTITFADGTVYDFNKILELTPLNSTDKDDKLYLTDDNDTFDAGSGNDEIWGGNGDDTLSGGKGDDILYGNDGNDILKGDKGDDILYGDYGDDTYIYSKGDGNDTIRDLNGNNIIYFKDIGRDGIEFLKNNNDLIIKIKESNETITIKDVLHSYQRDYDNFAFKFMDESIMSIQDIQFSLTGDDENNVLSGYATSDTIYGKKGDDTIYGGAGNDTYIYYKGDGNDTIYDSRGSNTVDFKDVIRSEVDFVKSNSNLLVKIRGTNEQITIVNFFSSESFSMNFKFADGNFLYDKEIKAENLIGDDNDNIIHGYSSDDILKGGGGNDKLYGGKGNDTLEGGTGNDILVGNQGIDTYVFKRGDGQDVIYALDADSGQFNIDSNGNYITSYYHNQQSVKGTDIIKFKEGITKNDLIFERAGANQHYLLIKIKDTNDSITVKDMFIDNINSRGIDKIEFADGSSMGIEEIYKSTPIAANEDKQWLEGSMYPDTIIGNEQNNTIYGKDGDDTIYGNEGKDEIYGGAGSDTIYGGIDNDRLYGEDGNDTVYGNEGHDAIYGGKGNDILVGNEGDDYLTGGEGDDIYIFNKGDGNDTISDTNGIDALKFGSGISKQDIIVKRSNGVSEGITVSFKNSPNDFVTIAGVSTNNIINDNNIIETFEFENGDRLSFEDIKKLSLIGSDENETLIGYNNSHNTIKGNGGDDRIYGGNLGDTIYGGDGEDYIDGNAGDDTLYGDGGSDKLYGNDGNDTLIGGGGDDELYGGEGNDTLNGGDGKDELYGNAGDDTLYGGNDNDELRGGEGEDTYIFGRGDGKDTIYADKKDIIKFKEGIKADDLIFEMSGSQGSSYLKEHILIRIKGTNDSILLMDMFRYEDIVGGINKIVFHDGSSMNFNEIVKKTMIAYGDEDVNISGLNTDDTIIGGKGNDILLGNLGNDTIYGGSGNDTLYGGGGDDILDGGEGDDHIEGGKGSDTYMFGRGSGKDTVENYDETPGRVDIIKIKNGVSRDDLLVKRVEINGFDSLLLEIKDTDDSMTVKSAFYTGNNHRRIDKIVFEDGSSPIELEEIKKMAFNNSVILGGADGGYYYARGDNSLIDLKQGNDHIEINGKNIIYMFGKGDGQDTIFGRGRPDDKTDIIRFKEGITKDDLMFQKPDPYGFNNSTFIIKIKDTGDSITVTGDFLFNVSEKGVNRIEFSDGSFLDKKEIKKIMLKGTNMDDAIYSDEDNDVVYGRGGNDTIRSSGKNSIIYGGDGDDKLYAIGGGTALYGEAGNDELYVEGDGSHTLIGGAGDDTYICSLPSKENTITIDNTGGGNDTLVLKDANSPKSARFSKDGNDLLISGNYDGIGGIRIKNHFLEESRTINKIKFGYSDNSITQEEINKLINIVYLSSANGNNNLSDKDKKDNVYTYTGGKVTISDNGGDDRVVFRLDDDNDQESRVYYSSNKNVLEIKNFFVNRNSIIENFDINDYWSITAQSIYEKFGKAFPPETPDTPDDPTPSNPGDGDNGSLTGGSEDNVFNYKGGMVSITDTGGNDKVIFKNPGSRVFYSSNGRDLKISTSKINSSNKNVLEVKNFFSDKNYIIEEFQISDYWTVTAESIYQAFGKTYPATQNAPLALLGVPNKTNEDSLNDNASDM